MFNWSDHNVMPVGIDALALYTPRYLLTHATLAKARGIDPEKFHTGLGQVAMSVAPPGEDVVTMAGNACKELLQAENLDDIEMLLFATESSVDQSKAAGLFLHRLLKLPARCRILELKQACYSATAGLQLAMSFLREHPAKKVLLIAADIARYPLFSPGESSQGAGAVALLLSTNPRILALEPQYGLCTEDVMDFWRPNYLQEALVDGKYSSKLYLTMLDKTWHDYLQLSKRELTHHDYFCFHAPVPKLVEKAHQQLIKPLVVKTKYLEGLAASLEYSRLIGNAYTASLYVCLISLIDNIKSDLTGKRIGFYSYGSGCSAEFFSGIIQSGYQKKTNHNHCLLSSRTPLSLEDYQDFYHFHYAESGMTQTIPIYNTGQVRLARIEQHKRCYETVSTDIKKPLTKSQDKSITIHVPGKLILSGEHAVLYGQPALAMAVNRYVTATISEDANKEVLFDLSDLSHRSHLSLESLLHLKNRIKQKYHRFIRGDYSIRDVLQKPFELAQYALSIIAESLQTELTTGVKITVQSDLPVGCGMGSSAATILSVLQGLSHFLKQPLSNEKLYQLALDAENMQHGFSSGLDIKLAMHGGCFYMHDKEISPRNFPTIPMFLVNTGIPQSSTGQCVEKVAPYFKEIALRDAFKTTTNQLDKALLDRDINTIHDVIRANHRLLAKIGVVPRRVQQFINEVEALAHSAKICGAGAIKGDAAGAVWVIGEDEENIQQLCKQYGYQWMTITGEKRGIHAA